MGLVLERREERDLEVLGQAMEGGRIKGVWCSVFFFFLRGRNVAGFGFVFFCLNGCCLFCLCFVFKVFGFEGSLQGVCVIICVCVEDFNGMFFPHISSKLQLNSTKSLF